MTRRLTAFALVAVSCFLLSCHKVIIRVERKGSFGLVHSPVSEPETYAYDGHVIGLPAIPLVNCHDVIRADDLGQTDNSKSRRVYREEFLTCSSQDFITEYTGYWPPFSDAAGYAAQQKIDGSRSSVCAERSDRCYAAVNHALAPLWYTRSELRQRVEAAWILDEYRGWPKAVEDSRKKIVKSEHRDKDRRLLLLDRAVPAGGCWLLRKAFSLDSELRQECGSYGYPVLEHEGPDASRNVEISDSQVEGAVAACRHDDAAKLRLEPGDEVVLEPCPTPRTLLSFIHLSDAQIREPNAKLLNREASRSLDKYIESFERDHEQELYSPFLYEAVIETINKEVETAYAVQSILDESESKGLVAAQSDLYRAAPTFMIHTGDAVDAGLSSEFRYFLETSNRLTIPWYQVLGNHDVLAFGNLQLGNSGRGATDSSCTQISELVLYADLQKPVNNDNERYRLGKYSLLERFAIRAAPALFNYVCLKQEVIGDDFVALPDGNNERPVDAFIRAHCLRDLFGRCEPHRPRAGLGRAGYQRAMNGFQDLGSNSAAVSPYYAFVADLVDEKKGHSLASEFDVDGAGPEEPRRIWIVALNTAHDRGAYGALDERQLRWLEQLLANKEDTHAIRRRDLVLMFAHHPIWGIHCDATRRRLEAAIAKSGNVIAFFAGHTHSPGLRAVPYSTGPSSTAVCDGTKPCAFWEVIAPSLISFPQQGRQVTIKVLDGSAVGYIDVMAFWPQLFEGRTDVERAMKGAERDACAQKPESCANDRPKGVKQEHMFSRLFFRLPEDKKQTSAACRPMHVQMPKDSRGRELPPCAEPCAGAPDSCKVPPAVRYRSQEP